MQAPTTRTRRAGFTLIELLMVIFLIGILASILGFAANRALVSARQTRILADIDQLSAAIETYKNDRGSYPPTWGNFLVESQSAQAKAQRITRHVSKAFPRYTGNYQAFRIQIAQATKPIVSSYKEPLNSSLLAQSTGNSLADGGLDINNLDPAETLVFWFGGLPDPTAETKLAGFRQDVSSPFVDPTANPATPPSQLPGRTSSAFPFVATRLVDRDKDGWWEYLQAGAKPEDEPPPMVYFDNLVYGLGASYPLIGAPSGTDQSALPSVQWGNITPYANDGPTPANTSQIVTWNNSQKFQIISCGLDNQYRDPTTTRTPLTQLPGFAPTDLEFWPSGRNFTEQDRDNLTNFQQGRLGDAFQ